MSGVDEACFMTHKKQSKNQLMMPKSYCKTAISYAVP